MFLVVNLLLNGYFLFQFPHGPRHYYTYLDFVISIVIRQYWYQFCSIISGFSLF